MCKGEKILFVAGIGTGNLKEMTGRVSDIIRDSECLIGAERVLDCVRGYAGPEKQYFCAYDPVQIVSILENSRSVRKAAVLLSGDIGFYSGAKKLISAVNKGQYEWRIITEPGISSVVYLAARLQIPWEDAALVSLHGKQTNFVRTLACRSKTFILLGGKTAGKELLNKLREFELSHLIVHVGKDLSYQQEKIISKKAGQLTEDDLEGLCTVMIENPSPEKNTGPHIRDSAFARNKTPMTKSEVRAVCIAKMELTDDAVVYDIGAGTGSVSVEIALSGEGIRVYAVEKRKEALDVLDVNRKKFYADNIIAVPGTAPFVLSSLEPPSHVFIGGSSGNLKEILQCVRGKNPNVRIVVNAASFETIGEAAAALKEGLITEPEITLLQASRSSVLGNYHMMTGLNPVYIIAFGGKE